MIIAFASDGARHDLHRPVIDYGYVSDHMEGVQLGTLFETVKWRCGY